MKKVVVYLAVTADKFSLPMALFENLKEVCKWENCSVKDIKRKIRLKIKSSKNDCFYIKVTWFY